MELEESRTRKAFEICDMGHSQQTVWRVKPSVFLYYLKTGKQVNSVHCCISCWLLGLWTCTADRRAALIRSHWWYWYWMPACSHLHSLLPHHMSQLQHWKPSSESSPLCHSPGCVSKLEEHMGLKRQNEKFPWGLFAHTIMEYVRALWKILMCLLIQIVFSLYWTWENVFNKNGLN